MRYTIEEFEERVKNRDFNIDFKGHSFDEMSLYQEIEFGIFSAKKFRKVINDKPLIHKLDVSVGEVIFKISPIRIKCDFNCGEYFTLFLKDINTISLCRKNGGYGTDNPKIEYTNNDCDCHFVETKVKKGIIRLEDEIVFNNFFRDNNGYLVKDAPDDMEYSVEYNLNTLRGRESITEYKLGQNVAFGQMSNMCIDIYINEEKSNILVVNPYPNDYTIRYLERGSYKNMGNICLDVWRWEASDKKTLKKMGYNFSDSDISFEVKSGDWEFNHYFDDRNFSDDSDIYSELKRI